MLKIKNEKCPFTGVLKKVSSIKENDLEIIFSYTKEFGHDLHIYDHTERDSVFMADGVKSDVLTVAKVHRNTMTEKHLNFLNKHAKDFQEIYNKLKF